jgi:hypothetical protein
LSEAEYEKRLKEYLQPAKAEWEEHLAEVTGPQVDEVKRITEELKERYGVEQKPFKSSEANPGRVGGGGLAEKKEELWRRIEGYVAGIRLELERIATRTRAEHIRDEYAIPLLEAIAALEALEEVESGGHSSSAAPRSAEASFGGGSEFKSKLWTVFHAVEEKDWERLEQYWRFFDELRRLAKPLEATYRGYVTLEEDINALEKFCRERNVEKVLWMICTILFGIDPSTEGGSSNSGQKVFEVKYWPKDKPEEAKVTYVKAESGEEAKSQIVEKGYEAEVTRSYSEEEWRKLVG